MKFYNHNFLFIPDLNIFKKELINAQNREKYVKLFVRENYPTYYDNIVIYKSSSKKKEEFRLPIQNIYFKINLSAEEKK